MLFSIIVSQGQTPDWKWAKSAGGTSYQYARSTIDPTGNIVVAGYFSSPTITFDTITLINTNSPSNDIFLAMYNPDGNVIWAKSAGGSNDDICFGVSSDPSGNIYLTGKFNSSDLTFGGTVLSNISGYDIFTVKYNSLGNAVWAKSSGGNSSDCGYKINVDFQKGVYVTGIFTSNSITFGSTTLTNTTSYQKIFFVKYDSLGNVLWAKGYGGSSYDRGNCVSFDNHENIYLVGTFSSPSLTFGSYVLSNNGDRDIFIAKYNSSGNVIWAKNFGGAGNDNGYWVSFDTIGNIFITGAFGSSVMQFDSINLNNSGAEDIFVTKTDSSGSVFWAKGIGGSIIDFSNGISTDKYGNCYITGGFYSQSISFGSTTFSNVDIYGNTCEMFVAKFDINGNSLWAKKCGGNEDDWGCSIQLDNDDNIYVTGGFSSLTLTFDSTTLFAHVQGNYDVFTAKIESIITGLDCTPSEYENYILPFPNPTNNGFNIELPPATRQVQIINTKGQIVQKIIVNGQMNLYFVLDENGIYFIQVTTDKQTVTKKLIVTN